MKPLLILPVFFFSFLIFAQPTSWQSRGVGGGGALFAPSISPHNNNDIYLQCDMSEVFHTSNGGTNWSEIHFSELISTGGQHTVEYTSDPNILYTVNLNYLTDERYPVISSDGGQTWAPIASDPTGGDAWFISADPHSTNRLLLASYNELFFSNNGGAGFQSVYSMNDFYISGVFWEGASVYVGTSTGMLVSIDNGTSFNPGSVNGLPAAHGFISFTGAKSGNTTRLMGTTAPTADLYPGINALDIGICDGIYRMDYGSTNWQSVINGIDPNHEIFLLASSQTDISTFYTAGTNPNNSFPVVYKTTDAGSNWGEVFLTTNNQNIVTGWSGYQGDDNWWYGEIVFGLDVAPNDPNTVIITDFGFAHISTNGGGSWSQAYVNPGDANPAGNPTPVDQAYAGNGLENTSCWNMHWMNATDIFSSFTDITAIRSTDGGNHWAFDYTGVDYNTVYHVVSAPGGTLYAAVSSVHDLYQSTYLADGNIDNGDGAILYSTDNGLSWELLHDFNMPVIWLALDPNNPNVLYASVVNSVSGGIYKTTTLAGGASSVWTVTSSPPRTEGHPYNVYVLQDGSVVSSWSGHRDPGFTASSGVFLSNDGGNSWQDVSMNDEMYYWTKDVIIDPNDSTQNTWYAAVHSGWGGAANDKGGLYKTTNRGTSWTLVFDSYRVESAAVNPNNPDEIYATTEAEGLWYCSNATSATPVFDQLPAYDFQHPMRVFWNPYNTDEIWVTSFGNGMKVGQTGSNNLIDYSESEKILCFPVPANESLSIVSEKTGVVTIHDASGRTVLQQTAVIGKNTINTSQLSNGIYSISINETESLKFGKILIQH